MVAVRALNEYWNADDDTARGNRRFCGACNLDLGGVYGSNYFGHPRTPDDVLANNTVGFPKPRFRLNDEPLRYYAFCPWCGAKFDENWWQRDNTIIENERAIDHYRNPGWHKGDTHEFRGSTSGCIENHWLGVSGGNQLCWCDPVVTPSLLGCTIVHNSDLRYEQVMAARDAAQNLAQQAEIEAFERRYAERSGVTVAFLHEHGRFGAVCDYECDYDDCEGFYMAHAEDRSSSGE